MGAGLEVVEGISVGYVLLPACVTSVAVTMSH